MKRKLLAAVLSSLAMALAAEGCSAPGASTAITGKHRSGVDRGVADRDFVLSVQENLPHRFPEGEARGVWLSSVPLDLDVFAFPKGPTGYQGEFQVVSGWVSTKRHTHHYLGKAPLIANLRNGTYKILFVHPDVPDKDANRRYSVTGVYPFIAIEPRHSALFAVVGVSYWTQWLEVEVRDEFKTAIVLFQREDQDVSDMLALLPLERNFTFYSGERLRNFHESDFVRDIDDEAKAAAALRSEEVEQAIEMLERGGIWAKKLSEKASVVWEVKPDRGDVVRGFAYTKRIGN